MVDTFGVHNIFTTYDPEFASRFREQAVKKLKYAFDLHKDEESGKMIADWTRLRETIRNASAEAFRNCGDIVMLAELIQSITLKISLMYLFGLSEDHLQDRAAYSYIAKMINIFWVKSKSSTYGVESDNKLMFQYLEELTGLDPSDPIRNPLRFILPAYEAQKRCCATMCRQK